jgi:serine/threonine protein kinase
MAPEVIQNQKSSFPADIWSVGATAVELAEGGPPYCEFAAPRAMVEIAQNGFLGFRNGGYFSEAFCDFVFACMEKDPKVRPTAGQLLRYPFITQIELLDRQEVFADLPATEIDFARLLQVSMEENAMEEEIGEEIDMGDDTGVAFGGAATVTTDMTPDGSEQPLETVSTPPPPEVVSSPPQPEAVSIPPPEVVPSRPPPAPKHGSRERIIPSEFQVRRDGVKTGFGKSGSQLKRIPGYQTFRPMVNAKTDAKTIYVPKDQSVKVTETEDSGTNLKIIDLLKKYPGILVVVVILALFGVKKGFLVCLIVFGVFFGIIRKKSDSQKVKKE